MVKRWVKFDAEGRLNSYADEGYHCGDGEVLASIPEDFDPAKLYDYVYKDGTVIYDPLPPADGDMAPTMDERVTELEAQNHMLLECVLEMSALVYA